MTNTILILGITLFFVYAFYDQFLMERRKGETKLKVPLKKQGKADAIIFIGLIVLLGYQAISQFKEISANTLFLLAMSIILAIYTSFIRTPMLILKPTGFFYANIFIDYAKIAQLNLADNQILVIDLTNGKRLLVQLTKQSDVDQVVAFFGGYKQ